jgi:hypothetical protein
MLSIYLSVALQPYIGPWPLFRFLNPICTLATRHIVVGHFVRSDTGHAMQAIDVIRHSRLTQQLVPSTTALSFVCCSQVACKKKVAHDFRYDLRKLNSLPARRIRLLFQDWVGKCSFVPIDTVIDILWLPNRTHFQLQERKVWNS